MLDMRDSINDLKPTVQSLRKQMARMEMKSLGIAASNTSDPKMMTPDLFCNSDATLATEGFPIATCIELNEFEVKLKTDCKYREKMVSVLFIYFQLLLPSVAEFTSKFQNRNTKVTISSIDKFSFVLITS